MIDVRYNMSSYDYLDGDSVLTERCRKKDKRMMGRRGGRWEMRPVAPTLLHTSASEVDQVMIKIDNGESGISFKQEEHE